MVNLRNYLWKLITNLNQGLVKKINYYKTIKKSDFMINSISIVIPSYNESENINEIYRRTSEAIKKMGIRKYEIIFVENGSKDNSL